VIENLDSLAPKSSKQGDVEVTSNFSKKFLSVIPSLSLRGKKVIILASATEVDGLDSSLRSPKVFGKEIELPVPSAQERKGILTKMLDNICNSLLAQEIEEIALSTHGFVGADLKGLCTHAIQQAMKRCESEKISSELNENASVQMTDLVASLKSVKPSAVKSILVDVPNVR
jgi:SpoVK/Ycf46/Vps4 family AAA+-type ATPase